MRTAFQIREHDDLNGMLAGSARLARSGVGGSGVCPMWPCPTHEEDHGEEEDGGQEDRKEEQPSCAKKAHRVMEVRWRSQVMIRVIGREPPIEPREGRVER